MKQDENNTAQNQSLINEIGSEVSQESAPLLEFITKNGGKIAGVVLLFLLITGISAGWQWYQHKGQESYLEEMAGIETRLTGNEKNKAMQELAGRAPSSLATLANMSLGAVATESNDPALAVQAYRRAAQTDADGTTGLMAALAEAQSLLRSENYAEALNLLESLEPRFSAVPLLVRQLKAEAAMRSGKTELAAKEFAEMAKEVTGDEADYLRSRSEALLSQKDASPVKDGENNGKAESSTGQEAR